MTELRSEQRDASVTPTKGGTGKSAMKTTQPEPRSKRTALIAESRKVPFTPTMIVDGLSQLGRTADGLKPAYLRLEITSTTMSSTSHIADYTQLQTLILNDNEIVDISHLSGLRSLTLLDVSHNKVNQVLGFTPAAIDSNLRVALFQHNRILNLKDLSGFSRLQKLDLSENRLEYISGMTGLRMLRYLHLSKNKLINLKGLEGLNALRELHVSFNEISSLKPISCLTSLEVLDASRNRLSSLAGLEPLGSLRRLIVARNAISALQDVADVVGCRLLSVLNLEGNPLNKMMSCRLHLVYLLPQVSELDGKAVEAKEKVQAANMHGSDAEVLRTTRRRFFPNGELDDGGGAIPPPAAGLVASSAEEEIAGGDSAADSARLRAWAQAQHARSDINATPDGLRHVHRMGHMGSVVSLAKDAPLPLGLLAHSLSSQCEDQLQLARAAYEWVCSHVEPPTPSETWKVSIPLFANTQTGREQERLLLSGLTGAWAERLSWLFCELCHFMDLEAVIIPGYWKEAAEILPGRRLAAHNHAWSGVKVNGKWRLVDLTYGIIHGTSHTPFFIPPEAFVFSHLPLEEHWQLMSEPITSVDDWWALPHATTAFFARGCRLLDSSLQAVNEMPVVREGQTLPSFMLRLAMPTTPGLRLKHELRDANQCVVAAWPPADETAHSQLLFQQVIHGPDSLCEVHFGANTWTSQEHAVWASPPAPGEWYVCVLLVADIPNAMVMQLEGLDAPLALHVQEEVEVLMAKVVLQPIDLHDPDDGILADNTTWPAVLPSTCHAFESMEMHLLSPPPPHPLEADRPITFTLASPSLGADQQVVLVAPEGTEPIILESTEEEDQVSKGVTVLKTSLATPRAPWCSLVLRSSSEGQGEEAGATRDITLVKFVIRPQVQHLVLTPDDPNAPEPDLSDPMALSARDIFRGMDVHGTGWIGRREMLAAFRRNRQVADILKFPARIKAGDGTYEIFNGLFQSINSSRLGSFEFKELCAYMGVRALKEVSALDEEMSASTSAVDPSVTSMWSIYSRHPGS